MRKVLGIVVLLSVVGIAFKAVGWKAATADIKAVCHFAVEGMVKDAVVKELDRFASLKYSDLDSGNSMLVYSPASFGRSACSIKYQSNKVVTSEYSFAD